MQFFKNGDPYGIRTHVAGVRGRSLRPLDQRATFTKLVVYFTSTNSLLAVMIFIGELANSTLSSINKSEDESDTILIFLISFLLFKKYLLSLFHSL